MASLKAGDRVLHSGYGVGTLVSINRQQPESIARVRFDSGINAFNPLRVEYQNLQLLVETTLPCPDGCTGFLPLDSCGKCHGTGVITVETFADGLED